MDSPKGRTLKFHKTVSWGGCLYTTKGGKCGFVRSTDIAFVLLLGLLDCFSATCPSSPTTAYVSCHTFEIKGL